MKLSEGAFPSSIYPLEDENEIQQTKNQEQNENNHKITIIKTLNPTNLEFDQINLISIVTFGNGTFSSTEPPKSKQNVHKYIKPKP
jgi:hypothetical protein